MEKEWEEEFDTPELMYCELLKLRGEIVKENEERWCGYKSTTPP